MNLKSDYKKVEIGLGVDLFLPTEGNIGISCSGGADSSLLLYLLMQNFKGLIHIFTCVSLEKNESTKLTVPNVIAMCSKLTGQTNYLQSMWTVEKQNLQNLFQIQQQNIANGTITVLYTGITANPPKTVTTSFINTSTEDEVRNPEVKRELFFDNFKIHTPFTNINKKLIMSLYQKYKLMDSLFPVTRSCESIDVKYLNTHCGKCWWCEERLWGFGRL